MLILVGEVIIPAKRYNQTEQFPITIVQSIQRHFYIGLIVTSTTYQSAIRNLRKLIPTIQNYVNWFGQSDRLKEKKKPIIGKNISLFNGHMASKRTHRYT